MPERIVQSHAFWLETCELDTHERSANHARLDTPWNAFSPDEQALVCTLWIDCIVDIHDPQENRTRRFVRLGGKSREWKGVAIRHGEDARASIARAVASKRPIFGYEAEPQPAALLRGERKVKHFYIERAHQLKGWIGLRLMDLEERLRVSEGFERNGIINDADPDAPATLFELVETTAELPHAGRLPKTDAKEGLVRADDEDAADNLSNEEYAHVALPLLIAHVLQQADDVLVPITYLQLAEMLNRRNKRGDPWARGLGKILYRVTEIVDAASTHGLERPPFLTSVVVLSSGPNAGLPDDGVKEWWPGYDSLSRDDKQAKVSAEHRRVLEFGSRWNEVLRLANMQPVDPSANSGETKRAAGGWGGGESEAHKSLKHFIFEHPELCGASEGWFRQEEYALRSGDEIDVMFKSDRVWIGVEVKSRISDLLLSDYERGLYQVVKYKAVLEAQASVDHPEAPPQVRVLLVLESKLPAIYRGLASSLGVQCLENVGLIDSGRYSTDVNASPTTVDSRT